MANGGKDCCASCPFNGVNKGELKFADKDAGDFFCEIRRFVILDPFRTYCSNHPIRNPLWMRTSRGPIWTSVHISLDCKPLKKSIKIPAEVVPPQGEGNYFRIPYFRLVRPIQGEPGVCLVCEEAREETITLMLDQDKKFFCSTAHYFEWWLKIDPTAITSQVRVPLDQEAIQLRFKSIPEKLSEGLAELEDGESEWLFDALIEVDEMLQELRNARIELMYTHVYSDDQEFTNPGFYEKLSPYLMQIQTELAIVGDLLQQEDKAIEAITASVSKIIKAIGCYIRGDTEVVSVV